MTETTTRAERRKLATRQALVRAGQQLIAEGRTDVPVLTITQVADVGMGSFYNHFQTKEELYRAAVDEALELQGLVLDAWTRDLDDPAEAFIRSFRMVGRLHRLQPRLSRVLISRGPALAMSDHGLAPRARRDLELARDAGRFRIPDLESALVIVAGTTLMLGQAVHDRPDEDDAAMVDRVAEDLLRLFGLPDDEAAELAHQALPPIESALGD